MRRFPPLAAPSARLLIVGLAPGLQGANRTGRPFTGDYAGDLLYATLLEYGFARGVYQARPDDGLKLVDCRISNAVRCVPPQNKPLPIEINTCRQFLAATIATMPKLRAIVALGRIAHESTVKALGLRNAAAPFAHGAVHMARPYQAVRQLSLLALQHEHRCVDAKNVSRACSRRCGRIWVRQQARLRRARHQIFGARRWARYRFAHYQSNAADFASARPAHRRRSGRAETPDRTPG